MGHRKIAPPLPPKPFRAPVHELAIAVRNERAILGIVHANEVIAAVRLDRAGMRAQIERMVRAARALGISDRDLAAICGIEASAPKSAPNPTASDARPNPPCIDCGAAIVRQSHMGRDQRRCPECRAAMRRQQTAERYRRKKALPAERHCEGCGVVLPNLRRRWCASCSLDRLSEYHREYWRKCTIVKQRASHAAD